MADFNWLSGTAYPINIGFQIADVGGSFLYSMSGYDGAATPTNRTESYYAPINSDGSIGSWTATTACPVGGQGNYGNFYNGRFYVWGKAATTNYIATQNGDGSLSSFSTGTAWSTIRSATFPLLTPDGYVLKVAGRDSVSNRMATTLVVGINPTTGAISSTTTLAANGMVAMAEVESHLINGYIYSFGTNASSVRKLYMCEYLGSGAIGAWTDISSQVTGNLLVGLSGYRKAFAHKDGLFYLEGGTYFRKYKVSASGVDSITNPTTNPAAVDLPYSMAICRSPTRVYLVGADTSGNSGTSMLYAELPSGAVSSGLRFNGGFNRGFNF